MLQLIVLSLLGYAHLCFGIIAYPNSLYGTEALQEGLTQKQLAIQRWFAQLTFLQRTDEWSGWGEAVNDIHCDGNTCIRYEISGLAYAVAVLSTKTPAYTQVSDAILYDAIKRMISKNVWQYIEIFDDFVSQPTYPDPVAYKNIMYSGHLAQVGSIFCFGCDSYRIITDDCTLRGRIG